MKNINRFASEHLGKCMIIFSLEVNLQNFLFQNT